MKRTIAILIASLAGCACGAPRPDAAVDGGGLHPASVTAGARAEVDRATAGARASDSGAGTSGTAIGGAHAWESGAGAGGTGGSAAQAGASGASAAGTGGEQTPAAGTDAAAAANGGATATGRPPGVAECYTPESIAHPAVERFRDVLQSTDYEARDGVIADLEAAVQAQPEAEHYVLLLGLAYLWKAQEPADLVNALLLPDIAMRVDAALTRAYELCPTDHRIASWLSAVKIRMGRNLGDAGMVEEGTAILRRGNEEYPTFVKFTEPLVYGDLPPTDPQFRAALESFREVYFLADDRPCQEASTDKACTNSPGAPHNREGFALYAGDFYARGQERDHALRWYMAAMSVPTWDSWRYRSVVEERVRTLDQRVAAALTPSLDDDLPSAWGSETACSFCHGK